MCKKHRSHRSHRSRRQRRRFRASLPRLSRPRPLCPCLWRPRRPPAIWLRPSRPRYASALQASSNDCPRDVVMLSLFHKASSGSVERTLMCTVYPPSLPSLLSPSPPPLRYWELRRRRRQPRPRPRPRLRHRHQLRCHPRSRLRCHRQFRPRQFPPSRWLRCRPRPPPPLPLFSSPPPRPPPSRPTPPPRPPPGPERFISSSTVSHRLCPPSSFICLNPRQK